MPLQAIIFDFDGVILDTESTEWRVWSEVFAEFNCTLSLETWAARLGRPSATFDTHAHLEQLAGRSIDRLTLQARRRRRCADINLAQPLRPGIQQWILQARDRGIKLAIASSSTRPWVAGHLDRLGLLPLFSALICAEDTPLHKPHPAPFAACLRALAVSPADAIAIEDSPHGIASAKAAGLFVIAFPNPITAQLNLSAADRCTPSLADLPLANLLDRSNPKPSESPR